MRAFDKQEIQRLQRVVAKVRFILTQLQQAIKGEVVMTEELQETLYAVYDAKVGNLQSTHYYWYCPSILFCGVPVRLCRHIQCKT